VFGEDPAGELPVLLLTNSHRSSSSIMSSSSMMSITPEPAPATPSTVAGPGNMREHVRTLSDLAKTFSPEENKGGPRALNLMRAVSASTVMIGVLNNTKMVPKHRTKTIRKLKADVSPSSSKATGYMGDLMNVASDSGGKLVHRAKALSIPIEELAPWREMFNMFSENGEVLEAQNMGTLLRSFGNSVDDEKVKTEISKLALPEKGLDLKKYEDLVKEMRLIHYMEVLPIMMVQKPEEYRTELPLLVEKLLGVNGKNVVPHKIDNQDEKALSTIPEINSDQSIYSLGESFVRMHVGLPSQDEQKAMIAQCKMAQIKLPPAWASAACLLDSKLKLRGGSTIVDILKKSKVNAVLHDCVINSILSTNDEYITEYQTMLDCKADTAALKQILTRRNVHFNAELNRGRAKMMKEEMDTYAKIQDLVNDTRKRIQQELEESREETEAWKAEFEELRSFIRPKKIAIDIDEAQLKENSINAREMLKVANETQKDIGRMLQEVSGIDDYLQNLDKAMVENSLIRGELNRVLQELDGGVMSVEKSVTNLATMVEENHKKWSTHEARRRGNTMVDSTEIIAAKAKKLGLPKTVLRLGV